MGRQIIKQPNGKYCIFSTIVDNITYYDMTEKQIVDLWVEEQRKQIKNRVKDVIKQLKKGEKPYHQFTQTYNETISLIGEIHGEEEATKVKSMLDDEIKLEDK